MKFYIHIQFEGIIEDEKLQSLEHYLKLPEHKIIALDMSSDRFKQTEINKVINVLNNPDIDNSKLDIINFGQRKISEKDLIILGKYTLKKFSARIDENTFDVRKYLFALTEVQTIDEDNSNEVSESKARELRASSNLRNERNIFFRLTFATNEIVQTQREGITQIIMDIDRPLTYDSYKILYLLYVYCDQFVDLKISNKNYLKKVDTGEPTNFISKTYKAICNARNDFFGFAYDREHEKRVKYHWLLKIAYLTWFTNMFMCILIPIMMRHDKCLEGILWL